jgi:hypothetical protein
MKKQIIVKNVLYYCDGVQVFDAADAIGGRYLGLFVEETPAGDHRYLVVGVSPESLRRFRIGAADLRSLIESRPEQDWFTVEAPDGLDQPLTLLSQIGPIGKDYLPAAGFVLQNAEAREAIVRTGPETPTPYLPALSDPRETGEQGAPAH